MSILINQFLPARVLISLSHLALVIGISLLPPFVSSPEAGTVTSRLELPFSGTIFNSNTNEDVILTGNVHLVSRCPSPADPCQLVSNLANSVGTGSTTGARYEATGYDSVTTGAPSESPEITQNVFFSLLPAAGGVSAQSPIRLTLVLKLKFSKEGELQSGEASIIKPSE
jgi:hypothetical protein